MFKRKVFDTIYQRLCEPRKFLQVVMGPRQVGKTTVVKQVLDALGKPFVLHSADAVPSTDSSWISQCWAMARLRFCVRHSSLVWLIRARYCRLQRCLARCRMPAIRLRSRDICRCLTRVGLYVLYKNTLWMWHASEQAYPNIKYTTMHC